MSENPIHHPTDPAAELLARLSWTRRLAASLVGDEHADDVAQEAWLAALRRSDDAWPPSEGWLAGTVRRMSARAWRGVQRRRERETRVAEVSEPTHSPEELVARNELLRRLSVRVLELDEPFRSTILLRFQEDLVPAEIARRLHVPVDTVRWRLREGVQRLRRLLEREDGPEWQASLLPLVPAAHFILRHAKPAAALSAPSLTTYGGLILSTKLIAVLALAVTLIAALVLWNSGARDQVRTRDAAALAGTLDAPAALDYSGIEVSIEPRSQPIDEEASIRRAVAAEPDRVDEAAACVIVGRVVGPDEAPLADVRVHFRSKDPLPETRTDLDGAFRLVVPDFPTGRTWLDVEPDPYHSLCTVRFGPEDRRGYLPPLHAGTVDLGTIQLHAAGVIEGRVTDENGAAIAEPWMLVGEGNGYAYPHDGGREYGDEVGHYRLEHIRAGEWSVQAQHYGHRSNELPVEVLVGTMSRVDLVLEDSSTISGTILDTNERPVPGVKVRGGTGYYYDWSRETDAAGHFTIPLAKDEPGVLEFQRAGWHVVDAPSLPVEPGTTGLVVHMTELPKVRFRVVDADTGEPIERCGLAVQLQLEPRHGVTIFTGGPPRPRIVDHPDGVVEGFAREGVDSVLVEAEGYPSRDLDIALDPGSVDEMTISLSADAQVRGRVTWQGRPVANATVRLGAMTYVAYEEVTIGGVTTRQNITAEMATVRAADGYAIGHVIALDEATPSYGYSRIMSLPPELTTTDSEGRFAFAGLNREGRFRIEAAPADERSGASPLVLDDFALQPASDGATDVGDLALPPATTLTGRIELGSPGELEGHALLVSGFGERSTRTDAEGRFRFDRLPPGEFTIEFRGSKELVAARTTYFLRLAPGAEREVVLPVKNEPSCRLSVRVTRDGTPLVGTDVRVAPTGSGDGHSRKVGAATDANGETSGIVAALGLCDVQLSHEGIDIPLVEPRVQLTGADATLSIDLRLGTLALVPPADRSWPNEGELVIDVRPLGDSRYATKRELQFADGAIFHWRGTAAGDEAGRALAPLVLAGEGTVRVTVESYGAEPSWSAEAAYTARANETVVIEL